MSNRARTLASIALCLTLGLAGCAAPSEAGHVPDLAEGKADSADGVEQIGSLAFGDEVSGDLEDDFEYHAYTLTAGAGDAISLEITQAGTARDLATVLALYGPPDGDGARERIGHDFDSGWGAHSRLDGVTAAASGEHLVVVGTSDGLGRGYYRLVLECGGADCGIRPLELTEAPPSAAFTDTYGYVDDVCYQDGRRFTYDGDPAELMVLLEAVRARFVAEDLGPPADGVAARLTTPDAFDAWLIERGTSATDFEEAVGYGAEPYEVGELVVDYQDDYLYVRRGSVMVAHYPHLGEVWTTTLVCAED